MTFIRVTLTLDSALAALLRAEAREARHPVSTVARKAFAACLAGGGSPRPSAAVGGSAAAVAVAAPARRPYGEGGAPVAAPSNPCRLTAANARAKAPMKAQGLPQRTSVTRPGHAGAARTCTRHGKKGGGR